MRLFEFELVWASATLGAVFPDDTALPHGIARMGPGRFLADTVAAAPFEQAMVLRLALWMVALAPLWLFLRPKTIASILPVDRERVLARLLSSSVYAVRQLAIALKAMASLLYAQSPAARRAMLEATSAAGDFVAPFQSGLVTLRARVGSGGSRAA